MDRGSHLQNWNHVLEDRAKSASVDVRAVQGKKKKKENQKELF